MRLLKVWLIKKCVLDRCCVSLCPKWRQQDWEQASDYSFAMKVRVMIFCTALSWGMRFGCITMRYWEKSVSFNDNAIGQDSLQNFHLPDHISIDLSTERKNKTAWLKTTHSTYHLTINSMFNLHVWQLPHFISSIWTKILKQNMFYIVYNYKVNLHFTDDELGQIIALHSYNIMTTRKKAKCRASIHT